VGFVENISDTAKPYPFRNNEELKSSPAFLLSRQLFAALLMHACLAAATIPPLLAPPLLCLCTVGMLATPPPPAVLLVLFVGSLVLLVVVSSGCECLPLPLPVVLPPLLAAAACRLLRRSRSHRPPCC
jgi:hypothetical protein